MNISLTELMGADAPAKTANASGGNWWNAITALTTSAIGATKWGQPVQQGPTNITVQSEPMNIPWVPIVIGTGALVVLIIATKKK